MSEQLSRVRAALAAGERPSDDDVRAVCADAGRYAWLRHDWFTEESNILTRRIIINAETPDAVDAAIDAAIREPK